ncbi:MAG: transcription-repair coupling factor [Candidatus Omnitrophica bacterium]|nr:transcription-repair coupling factor [Candidatus Omnitrophota bacterium]
MFQSLKLYIGATIDLEQVLGRLIDFGYKRQEAVSEEGEFSRRGGIIDIFPFAFELPVRIELDSDKVRAIKSFNPSTGDPLWEHQMVIILPVTKAHPSKAVAFSEEFPLKNFLDIQIGDYVVHTHYGIGKFLGLDKIKIKDKYKDHLVIEYDRQEKLYVPVDQMHLVQKYIAFQVRKPKLYRLGTEEWQRNKERVRKGIQKLAWDLLSLQAMRMSVPGFKFSPDTEWQRQFEAGFPYKETPDQARAAAEVKQDMESTRPMDRLLCGDVGYGKTEVAMRAAFKAVMDNRQVAFLVPTTILAEQHYQNFSLRLKEFPVNIAMLSRFKSGREQKDIIQGLAAGSVDIVIGTHRLLSDDIKFKNLGLVIIDEEQRFGVKAKEKLKSLRLACDILTLTATPIPRTLYMSLMGAKDLSAINTPPENRLPIKTVVVEYDLDLIRQVILRELARRGQVYFVHNHVQDIERIKQRVTSVLPVQVRSAAAHGQMPPKFLEKIMLDFLMAQIDVLFCTQIVESGIDIPNVNTIIINNAHAFGLADLHQLRGRVGRFNRPAFAYLIVPSGQALDAEARKRMEAIQKYAHLGAGFQIAMEDLEIRGAGNLLGAQQHGFVAVVGFDLYCRLLREAVGSLRKVVINGKI